MSADQSTVEYRKIKGFPDYRVGDDGSVWSRKFGNEWRRLKRQVGKLGYCRVTLSPPTTRKLVHRLVLEAFVGPCPEGMECRHYPDFDKSNCKLTNLLWGTRRQNCIDRESSPSARRGERRVNAVLTEDLVRSIRRDFASGVGSRPLSRKYGVNRSTIKNLLRGLVWKHVV